MTETDAICACERLIARYSHTIDHGDFDGFADLFAVDGRLVTPVRVLEGREAIRSAMQNRTTSLVSRHVITNVVVDMVDSRRATALSYLVLFRDTRAVPGEISPLASPSMIGDYRDQFILTDEGWRFATRELELAFRRTSLARTTNS